MNVKVIVWFKSEGNAKVTVLCKSEGNVKVIVGANLKEITRS